MGALSARRLLLAALAAQAAAAPSSQHDGSRPMGAPDDLDCDLKRLAVEFARKLLPERGALHTMHDALQLQTLCQDERPTGDDPNPHELLQRGRAAGRLPEATADAVIVDPRATTSASQRTVPTLADALAMTRRLGPGQRRAIQLREGVHYLNYTMTLGPDDSGTQITSHDGEHATLSGGILIHAAWAGVSDTERDG